MHVNLAHMYSCLNSPIGRSSCGVCCPMHFPKASSLRLPKMLLNSSPFHSPVELLIAFSSQKVAQLNQREAFFGQRKGGASVCSIEEDVFFFFPFLTLLCKYRGGILFLCYCNPPRHRECAVFCKLGGHRDMWPANTEPLSDI